MLVKMLIEIGFLLLLGWQELYLLMATPGPLRLPHQTRI
jgi:hypothetical protein